MHSSATPCLAPVPAGSLQKDTAHSARALHEDARAAPAGTFPGMRPQSASVRLRAGSRSARGHVPDGEGARGYSADAHGNAGQALGTSRRVRTDHGEGYRAAGRVCCSPPDGDPSAFPPSLPPSPRTAPPRVLLKDFRKTLKHTRTCNSEKKNSLMIMVLVHSS